MHKSTTPYPATMPPFYLFICTLVFFKSRAFKQDYLLEREMLTCWIQLNCKSRVLHKLLIIWSTRFKGDYDDNSSSRGNPAHTPGFCFSSHRSLPSPLWFDFSSHHSTETVLLGVKTNPGGISQSLISSLTLGYHPVFSLSPMFINWPKAHPSINIVGIWHFFSVPSFHWFLSPSFWWPFCLVQD